ncbi:MAG: hypothetical protein L3K04_07715 [Thermoplasmata archaeon]|nr:hypothetical protein [Thermoplasmata archaeon]MCI4342039.1 hypothetical protein [Thermoplasmata archaeon]
MAANLPGPGDLDLSGLRRLAIGGGLGVAGGLLGIALPLGLLLVAAYGPSGLFAWSTTLVLATSILLLAGGFLLLLSLFAYRRAFVAIRKVDRRFVSASVLCLVGTLGFLLLVISAATLLGSTSSLLSCLHGQPTHALTCVRAQSPLGAYTGLAGFWLGWLGGVGIVLGLGLAGRRFRRRALGGASVLYALLLLALLGPFIALLYPVPGVEFVLLVAPILVLLAPALAYSGSRALPSTVRR